jgi:hypothetical protein
MLTNEEMDETLALAGASLPPCEDSETTNITTGIQNSTPKTATTSEIKSSTAKTTPKTKFLRARDAFAAFMDDLATIPAEAFHPEQRTLMREWLHKVCPELFTKKGILQEHISTKERPPGMNTYFFYWLKGDPNVSNIFDKGMVNCLLMQYQRRTAEIAQWKLQNDNRRHKGSDM